MLEIKLLEIPKRCNSEVVPCLLSKKNCQHPTKRMIQPMRFLIPNKYKPIHADIIAKKIYSLVKNDSPGVHIYEGSQIYDSLFP
jgi:hypothetical protein